MQHPGIEFQKFPIVFHGIQALFAQKGKYTVTRLRLYGIKGGVLGKGQAIGTNP
jgi:hypothetical protein